MRLLHNKILKPSVYGLIALVAFAFVLSQSWPDQDQGLGVERFKHLPIQQNGRIKPLDTVGRTALLTLSGRQTLLLENKQTLQAATWLLIVATQPSLADTFPVFRVDHPQLRSLLGAKEGEKRLSYTQIAPHFQTIRQANEALSTDKSQYSAYENALDQMNQSLMLYHRLIHSFRPFSEDAQDTVQEYLAWMTLIPQGIEAVQKQSEGLSYDALVLERFFALAERYLTLSQTASLGIIPQGTDEAWLNVGQALLNTILEKQLSPVLVGYAELAEAAQLRQAEGFEIALTHLETALKAAYPSWRLQLEVVFNQLMPFYQALGLYVLAFTLILLSWLGGRIYFETPAKWILGCGFLIHTLGIVARMIIQGRPPVTSLYASALFVGWAAVALSIGLERIFKQGLGVCVGSVIGFGTLLIAHHLSAGEDTLEMVRAVLDANFWLSTHVIMVTLGYSAMFLAGFLGVLYILQDTFHQLTQTRAESIARMVYGTLCFALLFSFVGTLLGGIWADQSWGRFWGWDPKENGALLIVLWGAIILHAKAGKLIGERGLIICAVFGNILTSWSWFGTNMLGVGLHSYGFMDQAFWALAGFIITQLLIMAKGFLRGRC